MPTTPGPAQPLQFPDGHAHRRTLDLVDDEDRIAQRRPQGRDL